MKKLMCMCFVLLCGYTACGDSAPETEPNDDEPGAFDPGIDTRQPLNKVSQNDQRIACRATKDYLEEQNTYHAYCLVDGYIKAFNSDGVDNSALRAACDAEYTECMDKAGGDVGGFCDLGTRDCTATVGQAVDCVSSRSDLINATVSDWPECNDLTRADLALVDDVDDQQRTSECNDVAYTCATSMPPEGE